MAPPKKEKKNADTEVVDKDKPIDTKAAIRSLRTALNKEGDELTTWDLTKDDSPTFIKDFISTGSTLLDYIISNRRNGGIPCGKITELQGEESSGKSLLCAHIIANTQKKGGIAVYLDTENASNPDFMKRIGVDLSALIYVQPGTIEKSFETIEAVIKTLRAKSSSVPVTILWDSVGNTPPQAEIEGSYDAQSRMGLGAKAMAIGLRKITELIGREQITMVFTQPLTYKMGATKYEDQFGTKYGKALPYHASVRLRLESSTKLKDASDHIYGIVTNGKIIKSRLGTSHRKVKFEIHFDFGVDDERSWFQVLHDAGMIEKANGWCYISEIPTGEIEEKGINAGKDRGFKFREKEWAKIAREDKTVRDWVLNTFDKILVVKYPDKRPEDREGEEIPNDGAEDVPEIVHAIGTPAAVFAPGKILLKEEVE